MWLGNPDQSYDTNNIMVLDAVRGRYFLAERRSEAGGVGRAGGVSVSCVLLADKKCRNVQKVPPGFEPRLAEFSNVPI